VLPVFSEDLRQALLQQAATGTDWRRAMIHQLKEENPEINSMLLEIAQVSQDPKNVLLAGYLVYKAIELSYNAETQNLDEMIEVT
jgi:hypothetical protein